MAIHIMTDASTPYAKPCTTGGADRVGVVDAAAEIPFIITLLLAHIVT
jgi:hypothetical protein